MSHSVVRVSRWTLAVMLVVLGLARVASAHPATDASAAALALDRRDARIWYFGWSSAFAVALGVRLPMALLADDPGVRADSRVGAVTAGVGLLATLLQPPVGLFARTVEDADVEATAADERRGRAWFAHVPGIALNLGAGAFLWLHEDRPVPGAISAAIGLAVTELQIFTRPRRVLDATEPSVRITVLPTGTGVTIVGVF